MSSRPQLPSLNINGVLKMSEHTPTPWVADEVRTQVGRAFRVGSGEMLKAGKGCCIIYDDYGTGENERSANAVFIVKAANNHQRLVKALGDTLCELSHCATQLAARGLPGHEGDSVSRAQKAARDILNDLISG